MENWGLGRWLAAVMASLMLIFGMIVVGHAVAYGEWQLNWWYQKQNVDRSTSITFHSVANQSALRSDIAAGIAQVDTFTSEIASAKAQGYPGYAASLLPARYDAANTVCSKIAQLSDPGSVPAFTSWGKENCKYGSVSPSSKYYINR